jgi:hypothetical protein
VAGDAVFDMTAFSETVTMQGATVAGQFSAKYATFTEDAKPHGVTQPANMTGVKVGSDFSIGGAVFDDGLLLDTANIGGKCDASATNISVTLSLQNARCRDFALSTAASAATNRLTGTRMLSNLDLSAAVIQSQLRLEGLHIGDLNASGLQVGDTATLTNLTIAGTMAMTNSVFQSVVLSEIHVL